MRVQAGWYIISDVLENIEFGVFFQHVIRRGCVQDYLFEPITDHMMFVMHTVVFGHAQSDYIYSCIQMNVSALKVRNLYTVNVHQMIHLW